MISCGLRSRLKKDLKIKWEKIVEDVKGKKKMRKRRRCRGGGGEVLKERGKTKTMKRTNT